MKITSIAPLSYLPGRCSYHQFIRGGIGADHHQEPKFYQYEDETVLMYWNAYDIDECSENCVKLYSISKDHGTTWSDPQIFMADYLGGVPYFNYLLRLFDSDETLMLYARSRTDKPAIDEKRRIVTKGSDYFKSSTRIFLRRSYDGGHTFDHGAEIPWRLITGGKELPDVGFYGSADQLLQLESGRVLAVLMFMDPSRSDLSSMTQHYTGVCLFSDDNGHHWVRGGEISVDTPRGAMELQMVEIDRNHLFCLFRTKSGFVYQTESKDAGETWSTSVASVLPSPESMVRMIKLSSGNLLVVWNNVSSTTQQPRYPLVAALSKNNGKSWCEPKVIATECGNNQLSNHGMIQLKNGRILLAINHYRAIPPTTSDLEFAIFDEQWVQSS